MKRIFVAIFSVFMAFGAARADCASNEFAVGAECVESKFQITTIEMDADATFSFYISAMGTFYVDWGDGATEKIERTNTTETLYSHTYISTGSHIIQLGGLATGYSTYSSLNQSVIVSDMAAIRFFTGTLARWSFDESGTEINIAAISGNLSAIFPTIGDGGTLATQPRFYFTFANSQNLTGELDGNLFADLHGGAVDGMFYLTFSRCRNITGSIPSNLFADVSGIADFLFASTFNGCHSLGGKIPENLFKNISGTARYAFYYTFSGCSNLTGSLPKDLFKNISGDAKNYMFYGCFVGTNITGYIPPELFRNITGDATGWLSDWIPQGLYTKCPCGTHQYITDYESHFNGRVSCAVGTKDNEHWNDGVCTTDCTAGVTALKTSTGLSYPLLTDATAPQNIHIKVNNQICTVPLENGAANNAINMRWNGNTYHATVPDEIVPAGFTGQPE